MSNTTTTPLTQGQRLRKLRRDAHYTQTRVAATLGITKQAVYKYESDIVTNIPMDKLLCLAELFDTSIAWIQSGCDAPEIAPASSDPTTAHAYDAVTWHASSEQAPATYTALCEIARSLSSEQQKTVLQFAQFIAAQS